MARISCATGKGHVGGPATRQPPSAEQKYTDAELITKVKADYGASHPVTCTEYTDSALDSRKIVRLAKSG